MEAALRSQRHDPDQYYMSHGYTDMHARHSYITAHIFFEDLRNIQDSLPKQDIFETLMTKDDYDGLQSRSTLTSSYITRETTVPHLSDRISANKLPDASSIHGAADRAAPESSDRKF